MGLFSNNSKSEGMASAAAVLSTKDIVYFVIHNQSLAPEPCCVTVRLRRRFAGDFFVVDFLFLPVVFLFVVVVDLRLRFTGLVPFFRHCCLRPTPLDDGEKLYLPTTLRRLLFLPRPVIIRANLPNRELPTSPARLRPEERQSSPRDKSPA